MSIGFAHGMFSERHKKVASLLFLVAGFILLALHFNSSRKGQDLPIGLEESPVTIDLSALRLIDTSSYNGHASFPESTDFLALFKIHAKSCAPCINEIYDYVQLMDMEWKGEISFYPLVLVVDEDSIRASRFLRITNFPFPAAYASPKVFSYLVGDYSHEIGSSQKLLLVHLSDRRKVHTLPLFNRPTRPAYKRAVLEYVRSS